MNKTLIALIAIVIAGGAWLALRPAPAAMPEEQVAMEGGMDEMAAMPAEPAPAVVAVTAVAQPTLPAPVAGKKEFTVTGENFSFTPATLAAKKGDTVTIVFKNKGGFHDLKIDEFGVATKKIQGGAEESVTFVADKAGSFEYYCSVGEHRAMGMKGTLVVSE